MVTIIALIFGVLGLMAGGFALLISGTRVGGRELV